MLIRLLICSILGVTVVCYARSLAQTSFEKIHPACAVIEGKVLGENGRPVVGATVHSFALDQPMKGRRLPSDQAVDTDLQGNFSLRCVQPGKNVVGAGKESEGYADSVLAPFIDRQLVQDVTVSEHQIVRGVVVRLGPKSGRLTGRIVDAANQEPIEGAQVLLCRSQRPNECKAINSNTQGPGRFSLLVPPVSFRIKASAPNHMNWDSENIHIDPKSERTLVIVLKP